MQVADKVPADRNDGVVFVVQFNREVPVGQALIFCNRVDGDQMGAMHPNKLSGIQSFFQLDKWRADDELSVRCVNRRVFFFALKTENVFNGNDDCPVADFSLDSSQISLLVAGRTIEQALHIFFCIDGTA